REVMRPYMDLQINLHPQDGNLLREPETIDLVRKAMALGADGIGGVPEVDPDHADEYLDLVFKLAKETNGFVDVHIDQARDPRLFSPPIMAAKATKYGLQGKVTSSHSYSLGFQPKEKVAPAYDAMKAAGVHLACAPNQYLQERVQIPRSKGILVS